MGVQEQDNPGKRSEEHKFIGDPGTLHLTEEYQDFAKLTRSKFSLITYGRVAVVQEIRRHTKLRETIEKVAGRLGRKIDLIKRQA